MIKYFLLNQCIQQWCSKSATENTALWRCPGCQNQNSTFPSTYQCFCKKRESPISSSFFTPHSCGEICGRERNCSHPCTSVCHPGPCDPCQSYTLPIGCFCGRKKFILKCALKNTLDKSCQSLCDKVLNCGKHQCAEICHDGPCQPCSVELNVECSCGQEISKINCGASTLGMVIKCDNKCGFKFACGIHSCEIKCHEHDGNHTKACPMDVSVIKRCPCGKSSFDQLNKFRTSCEDWVPECSLTCDKELICGHTCSSKCHNGEW